MLVKPTGPKNAKIVIIGEAPGPEEIRTGIPFTGTSGELLNQCLISSGLVREELYLTNVVKVRPPDNKLDRLGELGHTVEEFYPILYKELREVKPNVIIALGATPLLALTGQTSITKYRGSVMEWEGIKVIPAIHPAACLRQWQWVYLLQFDLKRARKESEFPEIRRDERVYTINPSFEEIISEIERMQVESTHICVDLETYMRSGIFKCIGLADSPHRSICIPLVKGMVRVWSHMQERAIWEKLHLLLSTKKIIAQNAQFEMVQLSPYMGSRLNIWMDTMRAHGLLYPEFPHGLDFLTSIYTDLIYYKDDGKQGFGKNENESQYDMLQVYNGKDCCSTFEVAMKEEKELKEMKMFEFYHEFDVPLMTLLWEMQMRGMRVDTSRLESIKIETLNKITQLQNELNEKVGSPLNVKSTTQMKDFLYNTLRLPKKFNKKTNKVTADADAIEQLYKKYPREELKLITGIRENRTLYETFLQPVLDSKGRIHTSYGLTSTGRLSSGSDIFGSGANLQNQPKLIRDIYIPDEGKVLVKGDLSQAEARVVAWLAEEPLLKKAFKEGKSIHKFVCSLIFGIPEDEVSKESEEYQLSKNMVHASNYDVSPRTFALHVGIQEKRAKEIMSSVDRTFPNIRGVFHAEIQNQLRTSRTLTNPFGRRRTFLNRWGGDLFREAYAFIPQSTVGDVINRGAVRLRQCLPEGAEILLQVHDELVIQCYPQDMDEVIMLFKREVEQPILIKGDHLTIPLDIGVGRNWKHTVDIEKWKGGQ